MRKTLISILISIYCFLHILPTPAIALEDPLSVPNNKIGIHILFDHELKAASQLVNSNNGDWGYVTVAVQSGDRDLDKWQAFMNSAKKYHVIPILRLATEGDYFNTKVWRKPTDVDIVDFANFLDSLEWPVKNRYIIVFNEVNRGDEWGAGANPEEYAKLLSFAVTVFKSKSQDYFIIPAGLDNAAPNQPDLYMNEYNFMRQMNTAVPGIFNQVDGLASHSYPNPGFSVPPGVSCTTCINSFQYEGALIKSLRSKNLPAHQADLPVFLTETGWSAEAISDNLAANYYLSALSTVWSDPNIVAITPFLLQGSSSSFQKFSFLSANGDFSQRYQTWKSVPKIKGKPVLPPKVLSAEVKPQVKTLTLDFSKKRSVLKEASVSPQMKTVFKWLLKI